MANSNEPTTASMPTTATAADRETMAVNDDTRTDLLRRVRARIDAQVISFVLVTALFVIGLLYVVFGKKIEGIPESMVFMYVVIGVAVIGMGISALLQRDKSALVGWLINSIAVAIFMFLGTMSFLSQGLAAVLLGSHTFREVGLSGLMADIPMWLYVTLVVIVTVLAIVGYVRSITKLNAKDITADTPRRPFVYVIILIVLMGVFMVVAASFVLAAFDVVFGVIIMAAAILVAPPTLLTMLILRPQGIVTNVIAAFFMSFGFIVATGLSVLQYRGL